MRVLHNPPACPACLHLLYCRYGDNPNRVQRHTQFQVILKPDPGNAQELYLGSLEALGIDTSAHDVRWDCSCWLPGVGRVWPLPQVRHVAGHCVMQRLLHADAALTPFAYHHTQSSGRNSPICLCHCRLVPCSTHTFAQSGLSRTTGSLLCLVPGALAGRCGWMVWRSHNSHTFSRYACCWDPL